MALLIYHTGTGTYFGADDGVMIVDTSNIEWEDMLEFYNTEDYDTIAEHGRNLVSVTVYDPTDDDETRTVTKHLGVN